jgi:hypothetical protein
MSHALRFGALAIALELALVVPVGAQVSPTSPPHPSMPWSPNNPNRVMYGDFVRYIEVPAQQVTIQVPVKDAPAGQTQAQNVEIPGYTVAETTIGYWYPARTTLVQLSPGVYQWQTLPAEFKRK